MTVRLMLFTCPTDLEITTCVLGCVSPLVSCTHATLRLKRPLDIQKSFGRLVRCGENRKAIDRRGLKP